MTCAGEKNPMAKLDAAKVAMIRAMEGKYTQAAIATQFGVSRRAVGFILKNQTWKAA